VSTKESLRNDIKHVLRAMSSEDCQRRSLAIEAQLIQHLVSLDHQSPLSIIGLYLPIRGEPRFERSRWSQFPWQLAYPAPQDESMKYLIPEGGLPSKGHWLGAGADCAPDVIVVPGLAFSGDGFRLGRGGGFYDRLLASWRPSAGVIGICFEEQLREGFETEAHDQKMDWIITDTKILSLKS
jgi:5-formyltetrahydrofolate cyclo-ligase